MAPEKYVYDFDEPSDGGKELLGGKGVGLAEMTGLGVPVPAGFTVRCDACRAYMANGKAVPDGVEREVEEHLGALEERTGKRFGDPEDPLLVSVRSGAAVSMPGMMDTILNLGLNDEAVEGLARQTENPRFARDSYRRLIQMYGEVVEGVDAHRFEQALTDLKRERGVSQDVDLTAEDLAELVERMQKVMPEAFEQLLGTMRRLEEHYRDVQDIEFTVEDQRLYLLQTRSAKRTAAAAVKAAVGMVEESLISKEEAVARIDAAQLDQLLHPMLDPKADFEVAAKGLNASPGAASGKIVFDADTAEERGKAGESVILVRWETTPDDIHGLIQAAGILTAHGGMTSHAAVVARGMGKPCGAGCEGVTTDIKARTFTPGGRKPSAREGITIDGGSGEVVLGP